MAHETDVDKEEKFRKAYIAMESIGISEETVVAPVLNRLWKVYGRKNWGLIEANNYSTLADEIFEYENEKKTDANGSELIGSPDSKLHKRKGAQLDAHASPIMASGSTTLPCSTSQPSNHKNLLTPRESNHQRREGKAIVRHDHQDGKLTQHKMKKVGSLIQHGIATPRESNHQRREGKAIVRHDHQDGKLTQHKMKEVGSLIQHGIAAPSNEYPEKGKRVKGPASEFGASLNNTINIASSTCGKVKIALKLLNNATGQFKSRMPKLDAVMKHAEDKYLKSFKIVGPNFSMSQFLKQLCNSCSELGSSSTVKFEIEKRSADGNRECAERDVGMNKRIKRSASSGSTSLIVTEQQSIRPEKRKVFRKIHDISNGTEKVSISLVDEYGKEDVPKFFYIQKNTVFQYAYVQGSMARISDEDCCSRCSGDCLSSCPCECARQTGGEFAYTSEGFLKEDFLASCISMSHEPQKHHHFYCMDCPLERVKNASIQGKCNGHLVRKFVKECWIKCGCNMQQCGNRVVQRGITRKLQVFMTAGGKGWGVRTLEELPKGAFVSEYVGEILTNMELYERNKVSNNKARHTYPVLLDADWGVEGVLKDEDALCLDATYYGNIGRFVNHRCFDANLIDIPVEVESPDHHYYHLAFFTKRKVDALEELTWDYKIDFNDREHPIEAFNCCCGSPYCRDLHRTG